MKKLVAKTKMTEAQVQKQAKECRKNVGHNIEFIDHLTGKIEKGIIKSVWVDKRVPLALYAIESNGLRRNKVVTSQEMNILGKAKVEAKNAPKGEAKTKQKA